MLYVKYTNSLVCMPSESFYTNTNYTNEYTQVYVLFKKKTCNHQYLFWFSIYRGHLSMFPHQHIFTIFYLEYNHKVF